MALSRMMARWPALHAGGAAAMTSLPLPANRVDDGSDTRVNCRRPVTAYPAGTAEATAMIPATAHARPCSPPAGMMLSAGITSRWTAISEGRAGFHRTGGVELVR